MTNSNIIAIGEYLKSIIETFNFPFLSNGGIEYNEYGFMTFVDVESISHHHIWVICVNMIN